MVQLSIADIIGEDVAQLEESFAQQVQPEIDRKRSLGLPIARYDDERNRPYLEYPNGRREYRSESGDDSYL